MRLAGIRTLDAANVFLRQHYIAEFNRRFQVRAAQPGNAFVQRRSRDLDLILALQFERTVHRDNTVSFQNLSLQIEAVRWRGSLAGCSVTVHQQLDGTFSLTHGPHRLGRYSAQGAALADNKTQRARAVEKPRSGNVKKPTFPLRLEIPQKARDSHFPTAPAATIYPPPSRLTVQMSYYDVCGVGGQVRWVRIEGHFVQIPPAKKQACDAEVKKALLSLAEPEGIPYTIHQLHVRLGLA